MPQIALALGSNIGKREQNLQHAIELLQDRVTITDISSQLENPAVGGTPNQNDFLNAALIGQCSLSPFELLKFIKGIELTLGRDFNAPRWSARIIDIDIIFYGGSIIDSEVLTIPHKLMHQRDFVLIPLHEIAPDHLHPTLLKTTSELLSQLQSD